MRRMNINKLLKPNKEKLLLSLALVIIVEMYVFNNFGNNLAFSGKTALEFKLLAALMFLVPIFIIVYVIICSLFYNWESAKVV